MLRFYTLREIVYMRHDRKISFYIILIMTILSLLAPYLLFGITSQSAAFKIHPYFSGEIKRVKHDNILALSVFVIHISMLIIWWHSIQVRVIQKGVRFYLLLVHTVMLFYIIQCFFITTSYTTNFYLLRTSGYLFSIALIFIPLFGFYAALSIGREDSKLNWKWYLLIIPSSILVILCLTNDFHHLAFKQIPEEHEPNLLFHLHTFAFLGLGWAIILELMKIFHIFKIGNIVKSPWYLKRSPLFIIGIAIAVLIIKSFHSFVSYYEFIENIILFYMMETLIWEGCIAAGMVQVNTRHEEIFDIAPVMMQITDKNGILFKKSKDALPITYEDFKILKEKNILCKDDKIEQHISKIKNGYLIYQKDVEELNLYIKTLENIKSELNDEHNIIIMEEANAKNKALNLEQKRIFKLLSENMKEKIKTFNSFIQQLNDEFLENKQLMSTLNKIGLIATYIKRYGNLLLLTENCEPITIGELYLCFMEITGRLRLFDTDVSLVCEKSCHDNIIEADFSLLCCNIWENIIEYFDYTAKHVYFSIVEEKNHCNNIPENISKTTIHTEQEKIKEEKYSAYLINRTVSFMINIEPLNAQLYQDFDFKKYLIDNSVTIKEYFKKNEYLLTVKSGGYQGESAFSIECKYTEYT